MNKVCKIEDGVEIVRDLLLAANADERVAHLVGGDAEVRTKRVLRHQIVERGAGECADRRTMVLIRQTHIEVAVDANALDADVVVFNGPGLDRGLVGQIGRHRVHRIDGGHGRLLRFERFLPLFEIGDALGHLFTKLLRLSLDVRQLVGVSRHSEGQESCCRNESSLHVIPPNKARHQPSPRTAWLRSFE